MSKYTVEQVAKIVGTYEADAVGQDYATRTEVVKQIAKAMNLTEGNVRGVLVSENVYEKKEVTKKDDEAVKGATKESYANAFRASFGVEVPSMSNMTKKDLVALWNKFVEMNDMRDVA